MTTRADALTTKADGTAIAGDPRGVIEKARDSVVNLLLPVGYTPPRSPESNLRTKKTKARKARQRKRIHDLALRLARGEQS